MRVIFMGTPDFAVPTLQSIITSLNHEVVAVFSAAPKPKGRGMQQTLSPIHQLSLKYNIPVHNPYTLRSEETFNLIKSIEADIIVVVAYGFIIPPNILTFKKYGCLNIHPSSLPKYRGAAPMQRTIINGDKDTSVCIIQMDEGLDTGDILLQKKIRLEQRIKLQELHDICSKIGAELLIEALDSFESLKPTKQNGEGASYAHKLTKEEGKIDWNESSYIIDCKIRGMNPWPSTYFEYEQKIIKILEADYSEEEHDYAPGTVVDDQFKIACGKGTILIKKLQQAGKNAMEVQEFIKGFPLHPGLVL